MNELLFSEKAFLTILVRKIGIINSEIYPSNECNSLPLFHISYRSDSGNLYLMPKATYWVILFRVWKLLGVSVAPERGDDQGVSLRDGVALGLVRD